MSVRVVTDTDFLGEDGMVKVWNPQIGPIQVSDEGHLLDGMTAAWVDDNDTVRELVDTNQVVLLDGTPQAGSKKNSKQKSPKLSELSAEPAPTSEAVSDHLLAAPAEADSDDMVFRLDSSKME